MRLVLLVTALAFASASPASATPEGATGGATVPTTGGSAVPGETAYGASAGGGAVPPGGGRAGRSAERSASPPRSRVPSRESAGGIGAQAAQDGQPPAPPTPEEPDDDEVGVEVPLDEGIREPRAAQAAPSSTPLAGLATTGLAVAAFAALGAAAAAVGLGLRRLAR